MIETDSARFASFARFAIVRLFCSQWNKKGNLVAKFEIPRR